MPKAFELQVRGDADWKIDTIFHSRDAALDTAREMSETTPQQPVRVVEEVLDKTSGKLTATIIFQSPILNRSYTERRFLRVQRRTQPELPAPSPRPARRRQRKPSFVGSLAILVIAVGAIGLATLYGLAWVASYLH
jgi:hypothetical protein